MSAHVITHRDLVVRARAMGRVMGQTAGSLIADATARVGADTAAGATAAPDKPGLVEEAKTTGSNLITLLGIGAAVYFALVYVAPTFIGAAGKPKKARREYREIDPHVTIKVPREQYMAQRVATPSPVARGHYQASPYGFVHDAEIIE